MLELDMGAHVFFLYFRIECHAGKNHQTRVFARRVIWARAAFFRTPVNDSLMNILLIEILGLSVTYYSFGGSEARR